MVDPLMAFCGAQSMVAAPERVGGTSYAPFFLVQKASSLLSNSTALLSLLALCGCGNQDQPAFALFRSSPTRAGAYFQTAWQDESEFIVTAIVSDLAEMTYYAKHQSAPDKGSVSVTAAEKPGSTFGSPVYLLEIHVGKAAPAIRAELTVKGPIWSPEVYEELVAKLFEAVGLASGDLVARGAQDDRLLSELAAMTAEQITRQDMAISEALTRQFRDAALHENAALLLGVFTLRENSGDFFEIRSPLCRLTAHLALSKKLASQSVPNLNGKLADALLSTVMNNQKAALEKLAALENASPAAQVWVRALRVRNTDDYRPLVALANPTPLEKLELFRATCRVVDADVPWGKLKEEEKLRVSDYARIVNCGRYSVETGHELLAASLPGEMNELAEAYAIIEGRPLEKAELERALNQMPERCFGAGGKARVRVIGWGQWAMFSQRHICHALQHNFEFLDKKWSVPDEAKKFSRETEKLFSGLRLYPFVRRFNATNVKDYHRAVDEAVAVTINTPHLVSAQIWNHLCYRVACAELYMPSNPHINEWHKHNPPPGTAYDPFPRMNHPSLVNRPDTVACLETLHARAPYDKDIGFNLLRLKYHEQPTFEQMEKVYHPVLEYNSDRIAELAEVIRGRPEYEKLMLKAAAIDPYRYYTLADYYKKSDEGKAAQYLKKAMELHPDSVTAASQSGWLVQYYQRKGLTTEAMALADKAAETYSLRGLETKAQLLESLGKYDEALDYYRKIDERYQAPGEVLAFLTRYKARTGSARYDGELQTGLRKLFPGGVEKVTLAQLNGPPQSGVSINDDNRLVEEAGLKVGDIIVALYSIRVQNFEQYDYARSTTTVPEMNLIVWRKNHYLEVKASPPNHRFGANFSTWPRG